MSGLWLADNQLSHSPNLLQELLESFPGLSLLDLESNELTCDHLRLLPSAADIERQRWEQRFLEHRSVEPASTTSSSPSSSTSASSTSSSSTNSPRALAHEHNICSDVRLSCFFCSMRVVYLDCNQLTALPPELFTCLPNLRWVTAQRNRITSLPPEVGRATSLEGLRLDHNRLRTVPRELGRLPNLLCLSLCDNDLRALPEEMAGLGRLATLMVRGNPDLVTLPSCLTRLAGSLTEFAADAIDTADERPGQPRQRLGTFHRAESLLNIVAGQVLKMFEGKSVERHNIPEELKELLRCEGRQCAQCTGLYFGDGVAERIWETQLCNHAVLLRGNYCSLACLHSHTATPLCSHTH